mgnify:CR=1 FL=1|tara:strand:- start:1204 stop:1542 length:339 start_codon:yes stop_codon:yes gene_type:complete
MDLAKLLNSLFAGGNPMGMIILVVVVLSVVRGGTGGGLVDGLLDSLRNIFNRPQSIATEPEKIDTCDQQCSMLAKLAAKLSQQRKTALAKEVLDLSEKLCKAHEGSEGGPQA